MATLVLSAAGMALGGSIGGSVLGLSSAAIGRAAGAAIGRRIDQQILGAGSAPVEHGRVDRFRLTGASEGAPLQMVHGRMRVPGQVIWASRFAEHVAQSGGGKGAPPQPQTRAFSYSVSLALALCRGQISHIGRIWADGVEVSPRDLNLSIYDGRDDQDPDPVIEAVEGAGNVPAYRGIAYVVFDQLDLGQFGNRVPQFTFEVHRSAQPGDAPNADLSHAVRAVALIPGTGEYSLATSSVALSKGFAEDEVVNVHTRSGKTDLDTSLDALQGTLPRCGAVSLVVSWFGDDLRAGHCQIRPRVEQDSADSPSDPWSVAGYTRASAGRVPYEDARPLYGGTPSDRSVTQAIHTLHARGLDVMFYPFLLMEQQGGNTLTDPYSGAPGQPSLPWRGRITTERAPGISGSTDGTAAARAEVDAFFDGPDGLRAMILHYAQLCADAGGVSAFCIASEMRGLTRIRDDQGYPAVAHLRRLAADVRAILGPDCKIGYAADWSEYHGHQPGGGDKIFHLDPLWADPAIDFVGIDNYMPLSDWRDGDHLDAHWGDVSNLDYLMANVAGGELFDWYYPTAEARAAQRRVPITDGLGEPWIWRVKDLRGWWSNPHHNRINGVRASEPTAWQPGMKPIWFTEMGCAAVDRATNQPNKFLDPKSSESSLPRYSRGLRDDAIQMQYVRAMVGYWSDPAHNPVSSETGLPMVDVSRAHVWAWDARPWPAFPMREDVWSDGANYARGHWLNGRASARPLGAVVAEICARAGLSDVDVSDLRGVVRGFVHDDTDTARAALQPLMLAYGFDAIEREGILVFRMRGAAPVAELSTQMLATGESGSALPQEYRSADAEISGRVRIGFVEANGAYEARSAEAMAPGAPPNPVTGQELPLALTSGEGQAIATRWLTESRLARDRLSFALPPSRSDLGAGDVVSYGGQLWRIDRIESDGLRLCDAVRVSAEAYAPAAFADLPARTPQLVSVAPVTALFMDLPLMSGDEAPHAPHVAISGRPWSGAAALQVASDEADFTALDVFSSPAIMGETLSDLARAAPGRWDRGPALRVKLAQGSLQSVTKARLLTGANLAVIGDGTPENWELFQFARAELVAPRVWDLSFRLRGQGGSDGIMPSAWPVGSRFVLMDPRVRQIHLPSSLRDVQRDYRWGPIGRSPEDASWRHARMAFAGAGLRPYAVCHLRAQDHAFHWIRRSRIDGDQWGPGDIPLGETRELYHIRVLSGGVILREATVGDPAWSYGDAARLADGVGAYRVEVAQLSDSYGPGPYTGIEIPA